MSDGVFVELLALGSCMPGPTSTQMSFALGVVQKGISGGLLSGILFQYPGLILMSIVGFGAGKVSKPATFNQDLLDDAVLKFDGDTCSEVVTYLLNCARI
jgi:chromate transport protein ChrA